ncbi:cytochrome d ubiquinol oxidase subunit II [Streptomyces acidicola]|uniref:cytochrome d ubiquinol oxidase subunit II n=1 Tax=Streptomyces acidicola TaxID=2596892 RepID=UPI0038169C7D
MDVIWLSVLGLMLGGWFVLDGFTLGTGMLLTRLGRDDGERRVVLAGVGPFFLAGEVWLVVAAGVLISAFPELENELFTAFRPLLVLLLVCWVVRSASLWFRARRTDTAWRRCWEGALAVAGAGFAASWGLVLGNLAQGIPAHGTHVSTLSLFNPFALLCAVTLVALLALHGAAFIAARVEDGPAARASALTARLAVPAAGLLVMTAAAGFVTADGVDSPGAALAVLAVGAAATAVAGTLAKNGSASALCATAVAATAPVLAVGFGAATALADLAAPADVLDRLTPLALPAIGVVLVLQAWVLWLFRHRVNDRSVAFF